MTTQLCGRVCRLLVCVDQLHVILTVLTLCDPLPVSYISSSGCTVLRTLSRAEENCHCGLREQIELVLQLFQCNAVLTPHRVLSAPHVLMTAVSNTRGRFLAAGFRHSLLSKQQRKVEETVLKIYF